MSGNSHAKTYGSICLLCLLDSSRYEVPANRSLQRRESLHDPRRAAYTGTFPKTYLQGRARGCASLFGVPAFGLGLHHISTIWPTGARLLGEAYTQGCLLRGTARAKSCCLSLGDRVNVLRPRLAVRAESAKSLRNSSKNVEKSKSECQTEWQVPDPHAL